MTQQNLADCAGDKTCEERENAEYLGEVVCWKSPAAVKLSDLQAALAHSGFPEDLADTIKERHAFQRALKHLREGRIIRRLKGAEKALVTFQLTKEYLAGGQYEYSPETVVSMDTETGDVTCGDDELGEHVKELVHHEMGLRKSQDITRLIQRVFESNGDLFSIRDQGGVYFVPWRYRDLLNRMEEVLVRIKGSFRRFVCPRADANTTQSVAESVSEALHSMIAQLNSSIEEIGADSSARQFQSQAERILKVRLKLDAYAAVLQDNATQIQKALAKSEKALQEKIKGKLRCDGVDVDAQAEPPANVPQEWGDDHRAFASSEEHEHADLLAEMMS